MYHDMYLWLQTYIANGKETLIMHTRLQVTLILVYGTNVSILLLEHANSQRNVIAHLVRNQDGDDSMSAGNDHWFHRQTALFACLLCFH